MNLRNDYKYALVEEYKTYWDAYQDPQEFYSQLISISEDISTHFRLRKDVIRGMNSKTEVQLVDQNTLWFIMYGKTKRALTCLEDQRQNDITHELKQHRIIHNRKIIPLK